MPVGGSLPVLVAMEKALAVRDWCGSSSRDTVKFLPQEDLSTQLGL